MKYTVKYIHEVFTESFAEYVATTLQGEPAKAPVLVQIMREVEHYEKKRGLQFVSFFGNDMVIFKAAE